jgi:phosphoserine phosphatase
MTTGILSSWNDTPTRAAITSFVEAVTTEGARGFVPLDRRIATFDNDGTLWCEQPMPVELGFILERMAGMAAANPDLRDQQPWKAAYERDHAWLSGALAKHYEGDEADVQKLIGGVVRAFEGATVDEYGEAAARYLLNGQHPTLNRKYRDCLYQPMLELLRYLEANGFTVYIASGGDRDFMRQVTNDIYGIPPERVIGSSNALRYTENENGGTIRYEAKPDIFDDGPAKPVRIWSRIGQRPVVAGGNSNGDIPMLHWAGTTDRRALRLLVRHDDAEREFDTTRGADEALARAAADGWTVISMKDDWKTVFAS